jgi:hypothetical protein
VKAMLITLCGCSRIVEISDKHIPIRVPLLDKATDRGIPYREFVYSGIIESIDCEVLLVFKERQ